MGGGRRGSFPSEMCCCKSMAHLCEYRTPWAVVRFCKLQFHLVAHYFGMALDPIFGLLPPTPLLQGGHPDQIPPICGSYFSQSIPPGAKTRESATLQLHCEAFTTETIAQVIYIFAVWCGCLAGELSHVTGSAVCSCDQWHSFLFCSNSGWTLSASHQTSFVLASCKVLRESTDNNTPRFFAFWGTGVNSSFEEFSLLCRKNKWKNKVGGGGATTLAIPLLFQLQVPFGFRSQDNENIGTVRTRGQKCRNEHFREFHLRMEMTCGSPWEAIVLVSLFVCLFADHLNTLIFHTSFLWAVFSRSNGRALWGFNIFCTLPVAQITRATPHISVSVSVCHVCVYAVNRYRPTP